MTSIILFLESDSVHLLGDSACLSMNDKTTVVKFQPKIYDLPNGCALSISGEIPGYDFLEFLHQYSTYADMRINLPALLNRMGTSTELILAGWDKGQPAACGISSIRSQIFGLTAIPNLIQDFKCPALYVHKLIVPLAKAVLSPRKFSKAKPPVQPYNESLAIDLFKKQRSVERCNGQAITIGGSIHVAEPCADGSIKLDTLGRWPGDVLWKPLPQKTRFVRS
jgi:hypothetical protein